MPGFGEKTRRWLEQEGRDFAAAVDAGAAAQLSSLEDLRRSASPAVVPKVSIGEMRALAAAPRKASTGWAARASSGARAASPGMFAQAAPTSAGEAERRALIDRAYPFPASAAMSPGVRRAGTVGVLPAVIDTNGVAREVSDEAFRKAVPEQMRPMLARAEQLEYGDVDPLRFARPGRHMNMRVSDVGVSDPGRLPGAMARQPAPGAAHVDPVQTGSTSWVTAPPPFSLVRSGEVAHEVRSAPLAVTNITRPWHVFHPGAAVRVPFINPDGSTRIVTVSVGTNGLTAPLNQWLGPSAFGALDAKVGKDAAPRPRR